MIVLVSKFSRHQHVTPIRLGDHWHSASLIDHTDLNPPYITEQDDFRAGYGSISYSGNSRLQARRGHCPTFIPSIWQYTERSVVILSTHRWRHEASPRWRAPQSEPQCIHSSIHSFKNMPLSLKAGLNKRLPRSPENTAIWRKNHSHETFGGK